MFKNGPVHTHKCRNCDEEVIHHTERPKAECKEPEPTLCSRCLAKEFANVRIVEVSNG